MNLDLWSFVICALAVWRVSNFLADTDQTGPFHILDKIRKLAGVKYNERSIPYAEPGSVGDMITCVYCNSIWLGIAFYVLWNLNHTLAIVVSTPLALSTVAIFLQELINGRSKVG